MQKAKITSSAIVSEVEIEETKLKSFNKDSRENSSYRVFDGEHVGIQYVQGKCSDDEGYKKAEANLRLKRPYKFALDGWEEVLFCVNIANDLVHQC